MKYHDGEITVQTRAGVRQQADKLAAAMQGAILPSLAGFVAMQRMAVVGTVSRSRAVWASVLTGEAGFLRVLNYQSIRIGAAPVAGDPLAENLASPAHAALIVPDLATRRRLRLNGLGHMVEAGIIEIRDAQVYGNCPHYIQARSPVGERQWPPGDDAVIAQAAELSLAQQRRIERADTFFIATDHPEAGADVSHRGGNPGFVQILNGHHLAIPDYSGNNMFNTLGNIAVNPHAGLLFIDFETGQTLQLTGRATIDWDPERAATMAGARRVVDFEVDHALDNPRGFPLNYEFHEYSHLNPS